MRVTDQQEGSPPPSSRGRLLPSGFSTLRDIISFVAGLGVIGNEVWISKTAEPTVIAVGIAMLGLPAVFGADERKRDQGNSEDKPGGDSR